MKFEIGDKTNQALTITLVHELALCKESFNRFVHFSEKNILGNGSREIKIQSYSSYANFLHHLYEFYIGCIKRDLRDTSSPKSDISDNIINSEVEKLLRNKRHAIQNGYAPKWENHISVYQMEVPKEFARDFRQIRNRTAHADLRRAAPENHLTMGEFYKRYHGFVYILYAQPHWLWTVEDVEAFDWKAIDEFDLAVQS